jgi:ribosome-associated protein
MLRITHFISIDEDELEESFVRASGPGGQNVNKVSSAVQLRFDMAASPNLPDGVKERLARIAGSKLTKDGVIVLTAERFRDQARNREDARERLVAMIQEATHVPKPRRATKPTRASKEKRLDSKSKRGAVKAIRRAKPGED